MDIARKTLPEPSLAGLNNLRALARHSLYEGSFVRILCSGLIRINLSTTVPVVYTYTKTQHTEKK